MSSSSKTDTDQKAENVAVDTLISISEIVDIMGTCDRVEAYNFNGRIGSASHVECKHIYDTHNKEICSKAHKVATLDSAETQKLLNIMGSSVTFDCTDSISGGLCHIPHIGYVFYQNDSCIAQANICFICESVITLPMSSCQSLSEGGIAELKSLSQELGLKIVTADSELTF